MPQTELDDWAAKGKVVHLVPLLLNQGIYSLELVASLSEDDMHEIGIT
jgi:hypothetical protein